MMAPQLLEAHRRRGYALTSPEQVREFLSDIEDDRRCRRLQVDEYAELKKTAYASACHLPKLFAHEIRDIILNGLFPWCLKSYPKSRKAQFELHMARDVLGKWFNELCEEEVNLVWNLVVPTLLKALDNRSIRATCWTISAMGYRSDAVRNSLMTIIQVRPGSPGDDALATLISLGVEEGDRNTMTNEAIKRFRRRPFYTNYYSLNALGTPIILKHLSSRFANIMTDDAGDTIGASDILGLVRAVAERNPDDGELADQAINTIQSIRAEKQEVIDQRISMAGKLLPNIDSSRVGHIIVDLLLSNASDKQRHPHATYVRILRLQECVRPRQLQGLPLHSSAALHNFLKTVVVGGISTASEPVHLNNEAIKAGLWATLAFEIKEGLNWLPKILSSGTDRFLLHDLLQIFACFQISPLPDKLKLWVTEICDIAPKQTNSEEWILRVDAIRILSSACTREAYEALLKPGFTLNGTVLLETVTSLAEAALAMTDDPLAIPLISSELFDALEAAPEGPQHSAAVHAIRALALIDRLSCDTYDRLRICAFRGGMRDYDQSRLLQALIKTGHDISKSQQDQILEWAMTRDDRLGASAMEALIALGMHQTNDALLDKLSIVCESGDYRWKPNAKHGSKWGAYFVALLFQCDQETYLPTLQDVIRLADWKQIAPVYRILREMSRKLMPGFLPKGVRVTVLKRLIEKIKPHEAELNLFSVVADIAPEEFLTRDWMHDMAEWFVDARVEFCEAMHSALLRDGISKEAKNSGLQCLMQLTADGHYGVRRSAYRALSTVEPIALSSLIASASPSINHDQRLRAAEALAWISAQEAGAENLKEARSQIAVDIHKRVRQTYKEEQDLYRQRDWANQYIEKLRGVLHPSNKEMLEVWRYGWALSRIADDEAIERLRKMLGDRRRAPNVRHFIRLIVKAAETHWKETQRKWPEPILALKGRVEAGIGQIILQGQAWKVDYVIWCEAADEPQGLATWGGHGSIDDAQALHNTLFPSECLLRTEDGREGAILIQQTYNLTRFIFCGNNECPVKPSK